VVPALPRVHGGGHRHAQLLRRDPRHRAPALRVAGVAGLAAARPAPPRRHRAAAAAVGVLHALSWWSVNKGREIIRQIAKAGRVYLGG